VLLLIVSFADLGVAVSGLVSILVCQFCAIFFNFNRQQLFNGAYSFNALMVGLAMGGLYQPSPSYFGVLVISAMFAFFLTVWLSDRLMHSGLPMLSVPFLITIWTVFLGLSNFSGFQLEAKQMFSLQRWYPGMFTDVSNWIDQFAIRDVIHLYLRSLSAIFFQYNDLAGLLIAIAILINSRMSFALTVYGFLIGYLFYYFLEGDFTPLVYSYIGFNFMLTAIALGGFFIVPSTKSHLLLLFVVPVTALLLSSLHTIFTGLKLPLYSLPFNIVVMLIVGALRMRYDKGLQLVALQQFSPEKNHYKTIYYQKRFERQSYVHVSLPVIGEWFISQGPWGEHTHKEGWKDAWDFEMRNAAGQTFKEPGHTPGDYYCYDQPITTVAAGWVVTIKDAVPDNPIGEMNLDENWGNTIIIKHAEGLYSKLSHLKPYSIKVKEGDYVKAGELIASCGNSGRSDQPHLHFQLQATPYIGSYTYRYPVAYYLVKMDSKWEFHEFDYPAENETVRKVVTNPVLANAFNFIAGKKIIWKVEEGKKESVEEWEILVDIYNKHYIYCATAKATAYFVNDGTLFYFTDFFGNKSTFLYSFYLSFQKVLLGCYEGVELKDWIIPDAFFSRLSISLHDFIAPFFHIIKGGYHFKFKNADSYAEARRIVIETRSEGKLFGKAVNRKIAEMLIEEGGVELITVKNGKKEIIAKCEG
jgi:urea transporter